MQSTTELELRLQEIDKQLAELQANRYELLDDIQKMKNESVSARISDCGLASNMHIIMFAKDLHDSSIVKLFTIKDMCWKEQEIDCIEGAYTETYYGYMYRTYQTRLSFTAFLEHKDVYKMYVCDEDQFKLMQLQLCEHNLDHTNIDEYEAAINCSALRTIG